jgi:hypothetical protein
MRWRALAPLCSLVVGALVACNGIVGIADFHEVEAFDDASQSSATGDGETEASVLDGSVDSPVADGRIDAGTDSPTDSSVDVVLPEAGADAALGPPCGGQLIPLDITVIASPTMSYASVEVHTPVNVAQFISAGEGRRICLASGDALDLRGFPDNGAALHNWAGTPCGTMSRCKFNIVAPVVATVHLQ